MTTTTKNPWVETPLIESTTLSKAAGCRIFLKLENLQRSGSFKGRGIGYLMQRALLTSKSPSTTTFYSSSGGNAGLAAVHAASALKRPCTVIVPLSTKPMVIAKMKAAGAKEVQQYGASWKQADDYLRLTVIPAAQAEGKECVYVPPFDHSDIWTGHASMIKEIHHQLCTITEDATAIPSVIACSVGGGGLLNGIMQGLQTLNWTTPTVIATETQGADSLAESVRQNKHITLPAITSVATTLGATKVSAKTYELASSIHSHQIKSVVLTDQEAMMGAWRFAEDERMLVELACSVTIALCYGGRLEKALQRKVEQDEKVVIIVCGGSTVSVDMIAQWKRDSAHIDGEASLEEKENVPSATLMDV